MNKYIKACSVCGEEKLRPNTNAFKCAYCKGNNLYPRKYYRIRKKIIPKKCEVCGMANSRSIKLFGKGLHIHHKDGNVENNSKDNLATKCVQCHLGEHRGGKAVAIQQGEFGNRRIYQQDFASAK